MEKIQEIGHIEKGSGKHQSNVVYGTGGVSPTVCAAIGVKCWILILEENTNCATKHHTV